MATTPTLLTDVQRAVLGDERELLSDLRAALTRLGASAEADAALAQSIRQLDDLFLLVVVGEFNAGKSAFVNVLLGGDVLPEGVTPTTARITVVRFGNEGSSRVDDDGILHVMAPVDRLRDLRLVDTPGTNAVLREHEAVTTRFVPRADLVLFVTSADRPFTESERVFLERVRAWGKNIVFVVNKVDILEGGAQVAEVVSFVNRNARALLGVDPTIFPVSARMARRAREGDAAAWDASGLGPFERYLQTTLDARERVRLKLLNPLGVGGRLSKDLGAEIAGRLRVLEDDAAFLTDAERKIAAYESDMRRDFEYRWGDLEKLLVEMERRGHVHFDDTLRLSRVTDLIDRVKVQRQFEEQVVGDTPQRIERKVFELVDWLVDAEFRQWQGLHEQLVERRLAHRDRLPADVLPPRFHSERARLIDSVGQQAQQSVETFDHAGEARKLAEKARNAVAASAAMEVGAAGLGAVVAAVASTAAADLTGLAMAGVVATLGLLVIPNRRRQAKRELHQKIAEVREQLDRALRASFDDELKQSAERLRRSLEAYSRFVHDETRQLTDARDELSGFASRIEALVARIEAVT